jgi:isoleucyl-tRNA synthetase
MTYRGFLLGGSHCCKCNQIPWVLTKMAFKNVSGRYNGPELEQEILDLWDRQSIFDKSLAQSEGRPRFSFNEGPPTANGKPGIHHVLARTFKDIYPRYKTMRGYYAP